MDAEIGELLRPLGESHGIDDIGRLGDEIAGQRHALGDLLQGIEGLLRRGVILQHEGEALQRRLLLGLLARPVFVEAIGAQPGALGQMGRHLAGADLCAGDLVHRHATSMLAGGIEGGGDPPADGQQGRGIEGIGLAEPDQQNPRRVDPRGRQDGELLVGPALEATDAERPADGPLGQLVELLGRRRQPMLLQHADHDGAGARQLGLGESNFHLKLSCGTPNGQCPLAQRCAGAKPSGRPPTRPRDRPRNLPDEARPGSRVT